MISVVIPVYNREPLVGETLDSLLAQTFADWECIVVDDHSTDGSTEVVQKYVGKDPRIKLFVRPDDRLKGACACRNFGFENSNGDLVYFFDSDDLLSPQFFETVDRKMAENPQAEYGVFTLERFTTDVEKPYQTSRKFTSKYGTLFEQILTCRTQVNTQNMIWRRRLLERVPMLWDEDMPRYQDGDFTTRMAGCAAEGTWLEIPTMVHIRTHPDSIGGRFSCSLEEAKLCFRYRNRLYDYFDGLGIMTPRLHALLLWSLLRFQLISVITAGAGGVAMEYHRSVKRRGKFSFRDYFLVLATGTVAVAAPLIHLLGRLLGKAGISGFRRLSVRKRKAV